MGMGVILQQMVIILLLVLVGVFMFRKGQMPDDTVKRISWIVNNVTNPALNIYSVLSSDAEISHATLLYMLLVVALIYAVLVVLGFLIPRLIGIRDPETRGAYSMMTVYGNVAFIGIPLLLALLGNEAMVYEAIFIVVYSLLVYTHGVYTILSGRKGQSSYHISWKSFLTPGSVSALIALALFWFHISLPYIVEETLTYAGRCTTFLSMAVLGVSLAKTKLKDLLGDGKLYLFILIRQILVPILFALVLRQVLTDTLMYRTVVILLSMPAGNMPLIIAQQHGMNSDTLSRGIALTTVLSLVTITLVAGIFL